MPADLQPWDYAELHSPTEYVEVRYSASRTVQLCRRREIDARLIDGWSTWEQDAAERIYSGFQSLTGGMGFTCQSFERRSPGNSRVADRAVDMASRFVTWSTRATRERIDVSSVLDVLVFGMTCRDVDRFAHRRKGWCSSNLTAGLQLYCRLRGWPTK
jgi:hypothetical protein